MKRDYFYKDSEGGLRPYHYCSECSKQYNDDEFKAGLIINVGSSTTTIKYCAKPCLQIKFPPELSKKTKTMEEKWDVPIPPAKRGQECF
jgi:hypothetical protein